MKLRLIKTTPTPDLINQLKQDRREFIRAPLIIPPLHHTTPTHPNSIKERK